MAQDITDFTYELVGETIEISYTLTGKSFDRYNVDLYSSTDGFKAPLLMVSGDVGPELIPGKGKKLVWRAKEELGEFKGNISLKLITVFVPFLEFDKARGGKFRRGKEYQITWKYGGEPSPLRLALYKGSSKVMDLAPKLDGTNYTWKISKSMSLDEGYYFRATGNGREAKSAPFAIKRKVPMAAWIIPGAVVVGGTVVIILNLGTDKGGNEIPAPIMPN